MQIKVEGKGFGFYTGFQTSGFSPENGFREVGKEDFDSVLHQAANLTDKSLRALTTLALVEPCLKKMPPSQAEPKEVGVTVKLLSCISTLQAALFVSMAESQPANQFGPFHNNTAISTLPSDSTKNFNS